MPRREEERFTDAGDPLTDRPAGRVKPQRLSAADEIAYGGGDLSRPFLGQEVTARQDLCAEVSSPGRPDLVWVERQLRVTRVLPGGQYRHGESAAGFLVGLVRVGINEDTGLVVVADGRESPQGGASRRDGRPARQQESRPGLGSRC